MGPKVPLASLRTTYYCLLEPNYKKRVLSHQSVSFQFNTPMWDFGNPQKKCFFTSRNDIRWPKHCNLQYFWIYSLWPLQMHLPLTQISFILTNGNQQLCRKYLNAFTLDANIFYIDKRGNTCDFLSFFFYPKDSTSSIIQPIFYFLEVYFK